MRLGKTRSPVAGVLALGLASLAGHTAVANATLFSQANVSFSLTSDDSFVSSPCFNFSSIGATATCSGSATAATSGADITYWATATADYGVLKAGGTLSSSSLSGLSNTTQYVSSVGTAFFTDVWTITGGTGAGTLELHFALDGSYSFPQIGTGVTSGFSLFNSTNSTFSSGNPTLASAIVGPSGTINQDIVFTTAFTFGSALDFRVSLTGGANLWDLGLDGLSSSFDISNTAIMDAIVVKDATGNVIPFDLVTRSGSPLFSSLVPGIPTASVPAPGSVALLGAGLLGLAQMRRRSRAH